MQNQQMLTSCTVAVDESDGTANGQHLKGIGKARLQSSPNYLQSGLDAADNTDSTAKGKHVRGIGKGSKYPSRQHQQMSISSESIACKSDSTAKDNNIKDVRKGGMGKGRNHPGIRIAVEVPTSSGYKNSTTQRNPVCDTSGRDQARALRDMARSGDAVAVSRLLASPHFSDEVLDEPHACGWTALTVAAEGGHVQVLDKLLAALADVNRLDKAGRTALHHAAGVNSLTCVNTLLAARANVHQQDSFGKTALQVARTRKFNDVADALRV